MIYEPTAYIARWAAPPPCEYPPFVRRNQLWTPYWKTWEVGEIHYDSAWDRKIRCIQSHRTLEGKWVEAHGPDSGKSPDELGYVREIYFGDTSHWEFA